jgi:hypothetical protein
VNIGGDVQPAHRSRSATHLPDFMPHHPILSS